MLVGVRFGCRFLLRVKLVRYLRMCHNIVLGLMLKEQQRVYYVYFEVVHMVLIY